MQAQATCGRQGTSGMHPRVFHGLICTLMVKRVLLLSEIIAHILLDLRTGLY